MSAHPQHASCFHCGQPIADGATWSVDIDGAARAMCCPGCAAVAQAIVDAGQPGYYASRTSPAPRADAAQLSPPELALYDADNSGAATFAIEGIHCAACVWLIEQRVQALAGVESAQLNLSSEQLHVHWAASVCKPSDIIAAVRAIGYQAYPYDATRHGEHLRKAARTLGRRTFIAALCMMQVMMYAYPAYIATDGTLEPDMAELLRWASLLLTLPALLWCALPFFRGAWSGLRARAPGMDLPVTLGILAASAASIWNTVRGAGEVYFDSVTMFICLLLASRYLELSARRKAAQAMDRLQNALPASALRMPRYPLARDTELVAANALQPGDYYLARAGDAFAADATVAEGSTSADLSLLTGESAVQARVQGEAIPGGAINSGSAVVMQVSRSAQDSTLAMLHKLVARAGQSKPQLQLWADRIASRFVVALLALSGATWLLWHWIEPARAWPIAIAVLVVSCPCALSLAMPAASAAATARLLRRGVLVVRGHALETLDRATHIVFDKTGTLTEGKPCVTEVATFGGIARDEALCIAAALEASSRHPLGRAIAAASGPEAPALNVREQPGAGLEGEVAGVRYRIGSAAFVAELAGTLPLNAAAHGTQAWLGAPGRVLARITLDDAMRTDARATIEQLRASGKKILILSGDSAASTAAIARRLGIEDARGQCLPQDKLDAIQQLQRRGAVVAAVGDGINDAAILSAADVSFAMGSGAPLAQVHADAVLLSGGLSSLAEAARAARRSSRIVRQNLAWASLYNLLAIPAAALGLLTPWMSGVGMALSSALVVVNSLRAGR